MDAAVVVGVVAIVVAIIIGGWQIRLARKRHADSQPSLAVKPSEDVEIDGTLHRARPYPLEIIKQVDALPLAQQAHAESTYRGLAVHWRVALQAIHEDSDGKSRLLATDRGLAYPWIDFTVDLTDRPEVALAEKGQRIRLCGRVAQVHGHQIKVDPVKVDLA